MKNKACVVSTTLVVSCLVSRILSKIDSPYFVTFLFGHLYLSGICLGVPPNTGTGNKCGQKRLYHVLKI